MLDAISARSLRHPFLRSLGLAAATDFRIRFSSLFRARFCTPAINGHLDVASDEPKDLQRVRSASSTILTHFRPAKMIMPYPNMFQPQKNTRCLDRASPLTALNFPCINTSRNSLSIR